MKKAPKSTPKVSIKTNTNLNQKPVNQKNGNNVQIKNSIKDQPISQPLKSQQSQQQNQNLQQKTMNHSLDEYEDLNIKTIKNSSDNSILNNLENDETIQYKQFDVKNQQMQANVNLKDNIKQNTKITKETTKQQNNINQLDNNQWENSQTIKMTVATTIQNRSIKPVIDIKTIDSNLIEVQLQKKSGDGTQSTTNSLQTMQLPILNEAEIEEKYKWKIEDVTIGQGTQGNVYKIIDLKQNKHFALKIKPVKNLQSKDFLEQLNEIFLMRALLEDNSQQGNKQIVVFGKDYDCRFHFVQLVTSFICKSKITKEFGLAIVMELCQCSLAQIIRFRAQNKIPWQKNSLLRIYVHLLQSLEYQEFRGLCHRDVKPDNLLYSSQCRCFKISDYSEGKFLLLDTPKTTLLNNTVRGTPAYMSPELKANFKKGLAYVQTSPFTSDLYSLGIIFLQMLTLLDPISVMNQRDELLQNKKLNISNPEAINLISCLLSVDTHQRLKYTEIVKQINCSQNDFGEDDEKISQFIQKQRDQQEADPKDRVRKSAVIAECYLNLFKYNEALELLLAIVNECQKQNWKIEMCNAYQNIGKVYSEKQDFKQSLSYYLKALDIAEILYDKNSRQIGDICNEIGISYRQLHQFKEAESFQVRSLDIAIDIYGPDSQHVADVYNNMGCFYIATQDLDRAIFNLDQSIKILRKIWKNSNEQAEDQMQLGDIICNLGVAYMDKGMLEPALKCFEESLQETRKYQGDEHPSLITILLNLCETQMKLTNFNEASKNLDWAQKIVMNVFGEDSTRIAHIYYLRSKIKQQQLLTDEAIQLLEQSLSLFFQKAIENFDVIVALNSLSALLIEKKQYQRALDQQLLAIEIIKKNGNNEIDEANLHYNIGTTYYHMENFEQAKIQYQMAAKTFSKYDQYQEYLQAIENVLKFIKSSELKYKDLQKNFDQINVQQQ